MRLGVGGSRRGWEGRWEGSARGRTGGKAAKGRGGSQLSIVFPGRVLYNIQVVEEAVPMEGFQMCGIVRWSQFLGMKLQW